MGQYRYLNLRTQSNKYHVSELIEVPAAANFARLNLVSWNSKLKVVVGPTTRVLAWDEFVSGLELDEEPEATLRRLADQSVRLGDLLTTLKLREAIYRKTRHDADGHGVRVIRGMVTELSPSWLPPVRSRYSAFPHVDNAKICHIFKVLYPQESTGGAVRNWSTLKAQVDADLAPVACLPVVSEPFPGIATDNRDGVAEFTKDGVIIVAPCYRAFGKGRLSPDLLLEFESTLYADTVRRHRCSIVHATSGFKGFDTALKGMALSQCFRLPFIYEVRSFHEHTWGPLGSSTLSAPMTKMRAAQENRCMAAADCVVTISEAMVEELVARGIDRQKVFVIPNSVDDIFLMPVNSAIVSEARERYGLNGKTVIGYISNISKREGHEVLLRAFAMLSNRPDAVCLIVGQGPEEQRLRELALELDVAKRVIWTGEIDHGSIREMYSLIDVFVVPRLADYASDFVTPMKPFEALALGCKLIMSDRPVSAEIVGEEERGLMFRTGDHEHLAQRISVILDQPEGAAQRAQAGRQWVSDCRTWRNNGRQYKKIYDTARVAAAARLSRPAADQMAPSFL